MEKNKKKSNLKKVFVISSLCLGLSGMGVYFANAQGVQDRHQALTQKFAQKFGVDESEVENLFTEHREEARSQRQVEMKERCDKRLSIAVTEGKITEEQKTLVLTKREELQTKREELGSERKVQAQAHRDEMKEWAQENGIDESVLAMGLGGNKGSKKGHGRGMGGMLK